MSFILVYITNSSEEEAKKVAKHLLEKKLIACANLFPITSIYKWEGKIADTKEWIALVKTRKGNWQKVKDEVKKIHSYKIPGIIKLDAEANKEFEYWVFEETK